MHIYDVKVTPVKVESEVSVKTNAICTALPQRKFALWPDVAWYLPAVLVSHEGMGSTHQNLLFNEHRTQVPSDD